MIVDISVQVDHFWQTKRALVDVMLQDSVLVHPMVIIEMACATPPAPRSQGLDNLVLLQ